MDVVSYHRRAVGAFDEQVRAVGSAQWSLSTPCSDWDVRALVNHLVNENMWTTPLLAGKTIVDVGDAFDGDLVGDDPAGVWEATMREALTAVAEPGAMARTVHLSFGDFPAGEYVSQLAADYLVHSWDLATAVGADPSLDPELVATCAEWFGSMEQAYRGAGIIGARPEVPADAGPQTELLARFGRAAS